MAFFSLSLMLAMMAASEPALTTTQIAYMRCLAHEADAALRQRLPTEAFASGIVQVCEDETAAYRAAAIATQLAAVPQVTMLQTTAARLTASQHFAEMDAANRTRMIGEYDGKLRSRRGLRKPESLVKQD